MNIDFWQAIKGTQARLNITPLRDLRHLPRHRARPARAKSTCPQCKGTGNVTPDGRRHAVQPHLPALRRHRASCATPAPPAAAMGRVARTETVEVRIPPGARNGSRLRVAGKGNAGTMGAPPGDLYITTNVEEHPFFQREGDNIEIKVPVAVWEAAPGRQDRSAHHRRPHAAEDSAGHAERPAVPPARKGRAEFAHRPARRPDRARWPSKRPTRADERTARAAARDWRKLASRKDPRAEICGARLIRRCRNAQEQDPKRPT